MKEREGAARSLPGSSPQSTWSKHRKTHFRNVEAEGSNPFTSTKKVQVNGLRVESPKTDKASKIG